MKGRRPDIDHGKKFERDLAPSFEKLHLMYPCLWEKPVDSFTAGNIVKAVEGDFRLTIQSEYPGRPWKFAIECKASVVHETFSAGFRGLCKGPQVGQMNLNMRAGCLGVYLFRNVNTDKVEFWDARIICREYPNKRKPLLAHPFLVIGMSNMPVFAHEWAKNPQVVVKHLLV